MICFNVICRTCNCIVFSDFSLASHSLRHLHVVFFHSFVEWGGCSRGEGFYPLTLALLKEVGLWLRTHKCGKIPCQPLNPSDGPNLPYGVIAWISPMNSDDSWWWWAFTFNKQHDLISPHCGKHLTPSPTFSGSLKASYTAIFTSPTSMPVSHAVFPTWNLTITYNAATLLICIYFIQLMEHPFMYVYKDFCVWL